MDFGGAYTADRAAALSGVPKSTVHYWARKRYLVPSVSSEKVKLWSFADLMALRTIYWLRQPKKAHDGAEIPRSAMPIVNAAIRRLRELDLSLFEHGRPTVAVTRKGKVVLNPPGAAPETVDGQLLARDVINLIAPFESLEGSRGPDLVQPRGLLRIVPRKLSGAPHVLDTRVETQAIAALAKRGYALTKIHELYPFLSPDAIAQSIELEQQLARNIALRAA